MCQCKPVSVKINHHGRKWWDLFAIQEVLWEKELAVHHKTRTCNLRCNEFVVCFTHSEFFRLLYMMDCVLQQDRWLRLGRVHHQRLKGWCNRGLQLIPNRWEGQKQFCNNGSELNLILICCLSFTLHIPLPSPTKCIVQFTCSAADHSFYWPSGFQLLIQQIHHVSWPANETASRIHDSLTSTWTNIDTRWFRRTDATNMHEHLIMRQQWQWAYKSIPPFTVQYNYASW